MITIPAQKGTAFKLKKGQQLKVIDPTGSQVSDLYCCDAENIQDGFSAGRTIDYNESLRTQKGFFLYSHSGKKLMEIMEDHSPGIHDLLVTPCSLQMFQMMSNNENYHPSCLENLSSSLKSFGINENQITSSFNIFMNVPVDHSTGKITIGVPQTQPGDYIVLRACRDLIVSLTACSDEGTNGGSCKPIRYELSAL